MEHFKQGLSLNEEVTNLIRLRQEGSFWDFKKQWYIVNKERCICYARYTRG